MVIGNRISNNNAQSRRNKRARGGKITRAPAQGPDKTATRLLNKLSTLSLTETNVNGGTRRYTAISPTLNEFYAAGATKLMYEQFRVKNIQIFCRPNTSNINAVASTDRILAIIGANTSTTVASYVDYDTLTAPDERKILARDDLKIRVLDPTRFTKVADFRPRVYYTSTKTVWPLDTWFSCTDAGDVEWTGWQARIAQDSPLWGTSSSSSARISLYIVMAVEFKGLKADVLPALSLPIDEPIEEEIRERDGEANN